MQVSIWLVRALSGAVERAGASRSQFLKLAGVTADDLTQDHARLSVDNYIRVIDAAVEVTADPALGLHWGEHASTTMYHVVGHLAEAANTLGQALDMITRYSAILAAGFEPTLVEVGDRASLRLPALAGDSAALRLTAEFALTGFLRLLRQYVGPSAWPDRACFSYRAPAYAAEYRRVFGGIERFDQPFNGLEFPRAWLAQKQLYGNQEVRSLLESHAERELTRIARSTTVGERVQRILAAHNPCELPSLIDAARELQMSARTLSRKLRAEATNYAVLVEQQRAIAAKHLLERNHASIQEAAFAMGFGDAQSFHRAFKRWTGLTPTQYLASV
ncbi:MAG: hypothetical protein RL701_2348 [Pseudomonadota bacterium]